MERTLYDTIAHTEWKLLAEQKQALIETITALNQFSDNEDDEQRAGHLEGILHWIDAIQDAAENAGMPVVWIDDDE